MKGYTSLLATRHLSIRLRKNAAAFILILILFAFFSITDICSAEETPVLQSMLTNSAFLSDYPDIKAELEAFYASRAYHPAWDLTDETAVKKAQNFIDSVSALILYHGLDEGHYPMEAMHKLVLSPEDGDKQKLELLITTSLLILAHDLHGDALDLTGLYTGWDFHRAAEDIPSLLSAATSKGTLTNFFSDIAPQNKDYQYLASALQLYRALDPQKEWPVITPGPSLQAGDHNARITQLRARLAAEGYKLSLSSSDHSDFFDEDLAKTLRLYQSRNGLSPDGHLGGKTLEALNTPLAARIEQIKANMERWRHMPEDFFPQRYTEINIPDFSILIVEDNKEVYRGIVIDGRPDRQTPFINSRISNIVVNPSWHVPLKLAGQDILPKLIKDPRYLEKMGFVIIGREQDPSGTSINWKSINPKKFPYKLRQTPSDMNSLGQLKFNFSNPFDVYMHGTPHQELFDKAERDFSSGCVRLEDPTHVAVILLEYNNDKGGWSDQRIDDEIDTNKTAFIPLTQPIPVFFLYWSVFAGDDGQVNFRKDIYSYDELLMEKLRETARSPNLY